MIRSHHVLGGLSLTCALAAAMFVAPVAAADSTQAVVPPSIEDFLAEPAVSLAALSASGRYVAFVRSDADGDDLMVWDAETHEARSLVRTNGNGAQAIGPHYKASTRMFSLTWKGDGKLVYGVRVAYDWQGKVPLVNAQATHLSARARAFYSVDRVGGKITSIEAKVGLETRMPWLLDSLRDDPDHILTWTRELDGVKVFKVSLSDRSAELVQADDNGVTEYVIDHAGAVVGRMRLLGGHSGYGWLLLEGRAPGESTWNRITEIHRDELIPLSDFELLGPAEKPGQFYVAAKPKKPEDGDTIAIRILDFKTRETGPAIAQNPKYDMRGMVQDRDGKLLGGCYFADVWRCDYTDKAEAQAREALGALFPADHDLVVLDRSDDGARWLVSASAPNEPGRYVLFDRKSGKAEPVAGRFPRTPGETLGHMQRFEWTSRDGEGLSGYLTEPVGVAAGQKPPLVVLPHGGPEARDYLEYDRWAAFLSSRGYAVFQPNFRGSSGFGKAFAEAGYKQWGGRMQEDVADGVKAVLASGKVDPARVCVVGASFGGYAALYAGATDPTYRCVVSIAGDADLIRTLEWEHDVFHDAVQRVEYWDKTIGDLKADRAKLEAASPIRMVDRFRAPVLLIHGDGDPIVSVDQSRKMKDALKRAGKSVRYVELPDVGHTGWTRETEGRILGEVERFLGENLGVPAPAATAAEH